MQKMQYLPKYEIMQMGSIENETFSVDSSKIMQSTILKVAHHGSKTSSITNFLEVVKPKYALIGVGKNNKFGHPADSTLQNLENIGTKVFRTDLCGEIIVQTNGNKIRIKSKISRHYLKLYTNV